jgi:hypothetical protein
MFFTYTIRNLIARRTTVIPTMLAIVTTVAAIVVMQALVAGLLATLSQSGHAENAVVLSRGADSDATSGIAMPIANKVEVLPQIATTGAEAMVSKEFLVGNTFRGPGGAIRTVNTRGVDPIALKLHGVTVENGALPENHALGCVVGKLLVGKLDGFQPGGTVRIGHQMWPITGVLIAPSTQFESELWCDRTALMNETRRPNISVLYARLSSASAQDAFVSAVRAIQEQPLDAFPERVHFQRSSSGVTGYIKAISIISLILAIGATLACINAVYIAFLGRIRELSTLVAMGFTRGRVALITLGESLLMTLIAGFVGLGLGMLVNGRTFSMDEISLIYQARVTAPVVVYGLAVAIAIGVLGAIASIIHSLRLNVLVGLRSF